MEMKNRMIKTPREIRILEKSARISDSCIPIIEQSLKEKITEGELARRINSNIRRQGAGLSFHTLVASGARSFQIHSKPYASKRVISGIGYADFGARYRGYRTDITVPFVKGEIGKKEKRIIDATLKAYELAKGSLRVGDYCWKLFKKTDRFLRAKKFKMSHGLGHGIGLEIHELPFITMPSRRKLSKKKAEKRRRRWEKIKIIRFQPGMVFTIEPGVYVKKVGGCRLENDFLLTKKGLKQLTNSRLIRV
jgi:Xaa-Pro aminopeptidase